MTQPGSAKDNPTIALYLHMVGHSWDRGWNYYMRFSSSCCSLTAHYGRSVTRQVSELNDTCYLLYTVSRKTLVEKNLLFGRKSLPLPKLKELIDLRS